MTSRFGWMDQDDVQRSAMNEIVKMFQDQGSVDELGIGPIRDAFSNRFFPGTSVLHTRVRYLLFVPWLLADSTRRGHSLERARRDLRHQEVRLIKALMAGGEDTGVIGNRAQERLKTMPSQVYWPALQRFGVLRWELSIDGHLRRACGSAQRGAVDVTEADATDALGIDLGLDPELPPAPSDLLSTTAFDLTVDEAGYLQGVFARLPENTLLHWLAGRPEKATGDRIWTATAIEDLPEVLRHQVDHARRLHHAWHGAPLLYNLMLAEMDGNDDLIELYRDELDGWQKELGDHQVFDGWSQPEFWSLVRDLNPRLRVPTQTFVSAWFKLAESNEHDSERARDLIRQREILLKRRRSRLLDSQARETWSPGAGTSRLGFRWGVVTSFLDDIRAGLELADENEVEA
jgi:hypothetical protein